VKLAPVDYVILALYFAFVLGIGWRLRKRISSSGDFLTSGRSVPVWITSLAFIAANLGAVELVGMAASGAKYGIMTAHFYWLGAIPAMLFMGIFMMPFYYGSKARSVPEYLKMRFDEKTRAFNAFSFAIMTIFSSGISMYALGLLLHLVLGWSFDVSVLASAAIVLAYTFLGGLTSAIYNEVLQFFLIVMGFAPLAILSVAKAGGWQGMVARLPPEHDARLALHGQPHRQSHGRRDLRHGRRPGLRALFRLLVYELSGGPARHGRRFHVGRPPHSADRHPAQNVPAVHRHPARHRRAGSFEDEPRIRLPLKATGGPDYDQVLTTLMAQFYPAGLLGVGLTGLMASFMSGMAGNVTAFNTVFTYDIYQSYIRPGAPDRHYLTVGRVTTVVGVLLSIGAAYVATRYNNIMDLLQLVFGCVNAPLFATFLLGMFWKRTTAHGAFAGLSLGTARRGPDPLVHHRRGQGRLDRQRLHLPVANGAELLDRHHRVYHLFRHLHCGQHVHHAAHR
jgi:solute:Na+ symporter, SSS family